MNWQANISETNAALDQQEAYLHERAGTLHEPINAGPEDEGDWRRCATCGTDLYSIHSCPDAPMARCGCPLWMIAQGEHMPGLHDEP